MRSPLPAWCHVQRGRSDLVLIAPHGGRRPLTDPAAPRERKVNDLHTADLTAKLAAALDATAIINHGCDRNDLDLNRIGQITRRAPWFLELLLEELATILTRHARAQVLLIHGWNVCQPKCDLGVGGIEEPDGLHALGDAALSVDVDYWRTRIATFRTATATAGIRTSVGERYPAAHRSNLLQAFTTRFADSSNIHLRQLAQWARDGRLNSVQLELGIPVRWPGSLRCALHAAAITAFSGTPATATDWAPRSHRARGVAPLGFHFHDPAAGITAFTSITPFSAATAGRLLLFLGGKEIALFTGEESGERESVGGLTYAIDGNDVTLHFEGYATRLADADLYLDLEAALAASVLAEIQLDLRYRPSGVANEHGARAGHFVGTVRVHDRSHVINARGFCDPGIAMRGPGSHGARTHLAASFDDQRAFNLRASDGVVPLRGLVIANALTEREPTGELTIAHDSDPYTPRRFDLSLRDASAPIVAHPLARMPILRPLIDGAHARITFGPARFEWDGRIGWGVYEYARRVL
ncbi:MAG: hypothetical protein HY027_13220 [Deltaproteobacteria bacterium]|nr:hypothetical protein [Deltaproteobacteria bacterium]